MGHQMLPCKQERVYILEIANSLSGIKPTGVIKQPVVYATFLITCGGFLVSAFPIRVHNIDQTAITDAAES
jgi:hypothetical protein